MGADKLLGNGDMLFLWPGTSSLLRGQGTYLSDDEINNVVDSASTGEQHFVKELVQLKVEDAEENDRLAALKQRDELYEDAIDVVIREGRGSVSLLQRALGIGYGRAARLIDFMAEDGIVGPYAGSQAREVIISMADWERMRNGDSEPEAEPEPATAKRRSNKIIPVREEAVTSPRVSPATTDEEEEYEYEDEEEEAYQEGGEEEYDEEYEYEEEEAAEGEEEYEYEEEYEEEEEDEEGQYEYEESA
jgi:S-DNA-T family DNA segregation ATPase FtsK/SpoIIIE